MESVYFMVQIKYHRSKSGQMKRFSNRKYSIPNFMDVAKFFFIRKNLDSNLPIYNQANLILKEKKKKKKKKKKRN